MSLFLGPVSFEDFELPAKICFGGQQRLVIHRLPGGGRIIDAMGRDDAPIGWSGVFSGPDAAPRAQTLDLLRVQGTPLPLAWDTLAYTVLVSDFSANYERSNWIPYRITCTVVEDDTFRSLVIAAPVLQSMLGDLATAGAFGVSTLAAPIAALGVSDALVAGTQAYSAAGSALGAATAGVATSLAAAGTALTSASTFSAAAAAAQQCAQFSATQGYVQRANANFTNSGS